MRISQRGIFFFVYCVQSLFSFQFSMHGYIVTKFFKILLVIDFVR